MKTASLFIALARCALTGASVPEIAVDPAAEPTLFALARRHDLAHLIGYAMQQQSLPHNENWDTAQIQAMFRYERLHYEYDRIRVCLEQAAIPFVPLKGSVLRDLYPQPWMRTSCDIDVLVPPQRLEEAVTALTADGWTVRGEKNYHDISLFSAGGVHLELHFSLRENREHLDRVLDTVWEHCAPLSQGRYEHRMSHTFLMFHLLAHMAYHFSEGGCGVRSFMDIYLLDQRADYAPDDLSELCRQAHIALFAARTFDLCEHWFGDGAADDLTEQMEDFVLSGGSYGTLQNRVMLDRARAGGKWSNLLHRLFMPRRQLKLKYPILHRHPYLSPLFQVVRWWQALTGSGLHLARREWKLNNAGNPEELRRATLFLQELGL